MTRPPPLRIRPFRPADRPAVERLNAELQEVERALRPGRRRGEEMTRAYLNDLLARLEDEDEEGALFVAARGPEVLGFLSCFVEEDTTEEDPLELAILDLIVAEGARRQGVARRLLAAAEGFARARGIGRLFLTVLAGNEAAQVAYRALGFATVSLVLERRLGAG